MPHKQKECTKRQEVEHSFALSKCLTPKRIIVVEIDDFRSKSATASRFNNTNPSQMEPGNTYSGRNTTLRKLNDQLNIAQVLQGEHCMDNSDWTLHPHITLDEKVACDVAKIACALQSLSVYTIEALEDNASEELNLTIDEGMAAIRSIFIW